MKAFNYFKYFLLVALIGVVAGCDLEDEERSLISDMRLLDRSLVELYFGEGANENSYVQVKTLPEGLQYTWSTGDASVATVDQSGLITAKGEGMVVVSAESEDAIASVTVVVRSWVPITEFEIEGLVFVDDDGNPIVPSITAAHNGFVQVPISVPEGTTETLLWTTDNPDVAVPIGNGWVSGVSLGSAMITATTASGFSLTVEVLVVGWLRQDFPVLPPAGNINLSPITPPPASSVRRIPDSQMSFPGYNDSQGRPGPSWSSQAANGEGAAPNGRVAALLLNNNNFWHSAWHGNDGGEPGYPHWFIVDLGREEVIAGILLARRDGNSGTSEGFRVFVSPDAPWINQDEPHNGYPWINCGEYRFDRTSNDEQTVWLRPPYPTARYIKMYFGAEHRGGAGAHAMFRRFGVFSLVQ